ncbi:hypothetical protein V6N11_025839 [Hibiscus sabdariffa]|uniref:Alfin N-terminal domain-containing protein n=1 Tax=Hibiscus sabdariffa TaxID=183260 RepID=A0ABR2STU9_9ROSI
MAASARTVEEIFKDYSSRRTTILRALTLDVDQFYGLCDPETTNIHRNKHKNKSTWGNIGTLKEMHRETNSQQRGQMKDITKAEDTTMERLTTKNQRKKAGGRNSSRIRNQKSLSLKGPNRVTNAGERLHKQAE